MFSNIANNSASDKVKTRPRWNAYFVFIEFLKSHQEKIVLIAGYALVAMLFFNLGYFVKTNKSFPVVIQEPALDIAQLNNTSSAASLQQVAGEGTNSQNCEGKIKGNISGSNKIYHVPGGSFYARTVPELCFASEAEAQAAGFRKSLR